MFTRKFLVALVLVVLVAVASAYIFVTKVNDANARADQPTNCGGATKLTGTPFRTRCGYFTNKTQVLNSASRVLTRAQRPYLEGVDDAYIITTGVHTADKEAYIATIEGNLYSGLARNRLGAAFVIQTMRGGTQGGADWNTNSPPTPAQIQDWKDRIRNPAVTITMQMDGGTSWLANFRPLVDGSGGDDAFVFSPQGYDEVLNFRVNGVVVYTQRTKCANTYGSLPGLPEAPPKDYNLVPSVTTSVTSSVEAGSPISVNPLVTRTGSAPSRDTAWQLSTFSVPPTGTIPSTGDNTNTPAQHYGNNTTSIATGSTVFSLTANRLPQSALTVPDQPVGTRVCYALSVRPYNHLVSTATWRHSVPVCLVISKKPKVQILGNDLVVRTTAANVKSNIKTSFSIKTVDGSLNTYGSWGEYGVLASGTIFGIGSGSGYAGGYPNAITCKANMLTFTNATTGPCDTSTAFGGYVASGTLGAISSRFPTSGTVLTGAQTLGSLKGYYSAVTDISVSGGTEIAAKQWIVINAPTSTVTITGNISYTTSRLTSATDIPQVVIIAKNIIVANSVENIDAWLMAVGTGVDGRINTCGTGGTVTETSPLSSTVCDKKLTVNGPILANKLILRRTAGAGVGVESGNPAEVFNLRPDAYLWLMARDQTAGRIQTVYTQELPPRF